MGRIRNHPSGHVRRGGAIATVLVLAAAAVMVLPSAAGAHGHAAATHGSAVTPNALGMLDCNGVSKSQARVYAPGVACTDPRMFEGGHPARFEDNGTYVGRDAAARWCESWFTKFTDDYVFEVEELREVGDAVVAIVRHHGTGRASGVPVKAATANVYWLRDGLVVRTEIFWNDVDGALRVAAGESP